MPSYHRAIEDDRGRGRARATLASVVLALMFFTPMFVLSPPASSDPGVVDNGDFTRSVLWNFTDTSSYSLVNTTVSGGQGALQLVNETSTEAPAGQPLPGNATNMDLQDTPGTMTINSTSVPVQTLPLQPGPEGVDTYLDEWFPSWNADGLDLTIDPQYDPNPLSSKQCRIVMQFDLSSVPAGATIVNASLMLYEKGGKVPTVYYSIHALNETFNETYVSWRTRDQTHSWYQVGGDYSTESFSNGTIDGTNGWHTFDMTRLVDLWLRKAAPNYGFIIVPRPESFDGTKSFYSSDTTNKPDQRPKLVLNYTLGTAVGTYESVPFGPGTNSTFTLANWTEGLVSKASDEFSGSISPDWTWTKSPSVGGGSVNFATSGWLNVTGSQSTSLTNTTIGCNYLHQTVSGNFTAETSLRTYFSMSGMGAGLLVGSDDMTWLAIYKTGLQGSGSIVAMASAGGFSSVLGSVPWNDTAAFLRISRAAGTYHLSASANGTSWSDVAIYSPTYDLTWRVSAGLFVFSGGTAWNPIAMFDYLRILPVDQSTALELRARTGNSTSLSDPSWQPWGVPIGPSSGTTIGQTGKYVQYQATLRTGWEWLTPSLSGFACHDERYLPEGVITTQNIYPVDLRAWESMTVVQSPSTGYIVYEFSSDAGGTWQALGSGSSFVLNITQPSMMLRMLLFTNDTLSTPTVDTVEMVYRVSIASFRLTVPSTVVAGNDFVMVVEALDPAGDLATDWNGSIVLQAMDSTGAVLASGTLHVTQDYVSLGGLVTISNQRYDIAETIRIGVSAGAVRGISAPIVIQPGPITSLTLQPGNTTMQEHTSEIFTATPTDAFGNAITGSPITWTAESRLGFLNVTTGSRVLLTVGDYYTGGYLNVSCAGMSVSRWIDVLPSRLPPTFTSPLPDQIREEDAPDWTLDISSNVSDPDAPISQLCWYATNESLVTLHGENRTGSLIISFSTQLNAFGTADITIVVADPDGMTASTVLKVVILPVNDPPTFDLVDPLTVHYDIPYTFDFSPYIHDPDNTYAELTTSVDSANFLYAKTDHQYITFTYPESMDGTTRSVIVTVQDPSGASASTTVLIRVTGDQVPIQSRMLPALELNEGETLADCALLPDYFYDPDGGTLTFEAICEHSTIEIKADGYINVTAPTTWYGTEYAIIRAIDPAGARAEGVMQITVLQVDYPPVVRPLPDLKVRYDQRYVFDMSPYVADPDDSTDQLMFSANDPHCTFVGAFMDILYPQSSSGSVYAVTVSVSDGVNTVLCMINITVSADYPPETVLGNPLPDHSFLEDLPTPYPVQGGLESYFTDKEDGQALTFVVFSLNSNVTANVTQDAPLDSKVNFQTVENYNGVSGLVIRAVDSQGAFVERTITLTVVPVPDPPKLSLPPTFVVTEGQQYILSLEQYVTDPDSSFKDNDFTFQITPAQGSPTETEGYLKYIRILPGMFVFDFPDGFVGGASKKTFQIEVKVTDQDGKTDVGTLTVTVERTASPSNLLLIAGMALSGSLAVGLFFVVMMRRKRPFVIRDMMLIHNDGFLIGRYAGHAHVQGEIDEDILSGMLTAVLNFVEDSMVTSQDQLKTFGFKGFQVLVKRGTKTFAAIVFEGDLPDNLEKPLSAFVETFERVYKKKVMNWTGDIDTDFAGVELLIQSFVREHSRKRGGKAMRLWVSKGSEGEGATAK